jgi:putative radical SAM enzyme (TIGR03279 family)
MLEINSIEPGSIADELGLQPSDKLLSVNGEVINDLVDFLIEEPEETLLLEVERSDGELWELEIEHDGKEPLGLGLPHPEPKQCGNNCIFCFVHQLPRGMRRTLYIKDEDYRFSYLYGAYVTLTNLSEEDVQRILRKRLSPLYISVHAVDSELRQRLLGKPVPDVMPLMKELVDGGIELNTQVVVCPGINDGEYLAKTLDALVELAPGVKSLAVVPVGLTGHRQRLPDLRTHSKAEADTLVNWVESRQAELMPRLGTRFIFAADELYLKADRDFPPLTDYEDLAQIENGVGLIPVFRMQAKEVLAEVHELSLPPVSLVTGVSAAGEIERFAGQLAKQCGLDLRVHAVANHFFGGQVTVTGLLTGQDLIEQLANVDLGQILLVPDVMLREGEDLLLDDVRISNLAEALQVEVEVVPADPWGIWDMLDTLGEEFATRLPTEMSGEKS